MKRSFVYTCDPIAIILSIVCYLVSVDTGAIYEDAIFICFLNIKKKSWEAAAPSLSLSFALFLFLSLNSPKMGPPSGSAY